jgi:hypothetical protein
MAHSVTNAGIMRRNTPGFYSKLSAYLESPCAAQYEVLESLSDKPVCPFNSELSIIGGVASPRRKKVAWTDELIDSFVSDDIIL